MSATDELRRMLSERGVEWWPMHDDEAGYRDDRDTEFLVYGCKHVAHEWGCRLQVDMLTPEQAIAATLGANDGNEPKSDVRAADVDANDANATLGGGKLTAERERIAELEAENRRQSADLYATACANDKLEDLAIDLYCQLLNAYDAKELDGFAERMRNLGIGVDGWE